LEKTGKKSAPAVFVKGTYIGGCNDGTEPWHGVLPCLESGKLKEMLGMPPDVDAPAALDAEIASADVVFFDLET